MTTDAPWRIASASVIGTSHTKTGSPCQDNQSYRVFWNANDEPTLAVVVSDGAGSASRAEIGSATACAALIEQIEVFLAEGRRISDVTEVDGRGWLDAIREAISEHASSDNLAMRDFACTLLVGVLGIDTAIFMQVGDGAIIVPGEADGWRWVFWPERGEFANTTYFVTDENAAGRLQVAIWKQRVDEVALLTDGIEPLVLHYGTKMVHSPFFDRMFPPVRVSTAAGQDLALSAQLESYLHSPAINDRTDDDKTLVLASRLVAQLPSASPESSETPTANG
jgi:hypothetical protein